jgi:Trk-type K+ transport system membrane component
MNWLRRPELWFPVALLVVAGVGGRLLTSERCVHLSERDRNSYGQRPYWQASFDALSATCGVGLLTYRLDKDYTPAGRWVLALLGVAGAVLYLAAARHMAARMWPTGRERLPSTQLILAAFVAAQLLAILVVVLVERAGGAKTSVADSAWNAVSVFSSLGWLREPAGFRHTWVYAVVALAGALGWPLWLVAWPQSLRLGGKVSRQRGRGEHANTACPAFGEPDRAIRQGLLFATSSYIVFLLVCAGLDSAREVPRGTPHGKPAATDRLAGQPELARYERALTLVTCASGAGVSTEPLDDRSVGEGTKLVLAGVVLIGGLGGSAGGGLKWSLLVCASAALFGWRRKGPEMSGRASRFGLFRSAYAQLLLGLTLLVALGLLLIESRTGSSYQAPPTLGDTVLDAASAIGGAGLSTGLTATLTNVNLSAGIRQNVDLYQYGMTWLMLAMFLGRVLPVLVIGRFADRHSPDEPARPPQLI